MATNEKKSSSLLRQHPLVAALTLLAWSCFVVYVAMLSDMMQELAQLHHSSRRWPGSASLQHLLQQVNGDDDDPQQGGYDPIPVEEVVSFLETWIQELHDKLMGLNLQSEDLMTPTKDKNYKKIWNTYHNHTLTKLIPWDKDYLQRRIPKRREEEDSIFLSIASFRDENCPRTLGDAFDRAAHPEKLFVGLNQQNCYENCKTGVLVGNKVESTEPDVDCEKVFCETHPQWCSHLRVLHVQETDSLGPYAARYFASKLWHGETWYVQMDAHMNFLQDWDSVAVNMMRAAPTVRPIISHYPPGHKMDLVVQSTKPAGRLCGPVFTNSNSAIIRLEGLAKWDKVKLDTPRFAPFVGAGFIVAHTDFLRDVPFDPLLPYIFMGEEIIMSARLWTHGYDMYSPAQAVVGHMYVRPHKPKFWESTARFLHTGDALEDFVLGRIKHQLGYPETALDMLDDWSLLDGLDLYGLGKKRKLGDYLTSVGIDVVSKQIIRTGWCEEGRVPTGFEQYAHLYNTTKE